MQYFLEIYYRQFTGLTKMPILTGTCWNDTTRNKQIKQIDMVYITCRIYCYLEFTSNI